MKAQYHQMDEYNHTHQLGRAYRRIIDSRPVIIQTTTVGRSRHV